MVNVVGDGNCYFRCLSKWFKDTEGKHEEYREAIVKELANNWKSFGVLMDEGNSYERYQRHVTLMSVSGMDPTSYATELEIYATSAVFNIDVFIRKQNRGKYEWNMHSFINGTMNVDCKHDREYMAIHNEHDHYQLIY